MTTTTERIAAMLEVAKAKAQKQEAILKKHRADIQTTAKESPDMILSAMPAKLQNLQDCVTWRFSSVKSRCWRNWRKTSKKEAPVSALAAQIRVLWRERIIALLERVPVEWRCLRSNAVSNPAQRGSCFVQVEQLNSG